MSLFDEYRAHGWALCDIPPGTKGPTTKGWSERGVTARGNVGLGLCHAYSGTCSLDVDDYAKAAEFLLPLGIDLDALLLDSAAVRIVSGRANRAKLLFRLATPLPSISLAPYQKTSDRTGKPQTFHAFELRCATRDGKTVQDVLPPTIHPDTGRPYQWEYGDELAGHWSNLPEIPAALLALWKRYAAPDSATAGPVDAKGASTFEIRHLVYGVDPNTLGYDEWLKMGARIHHETGGSQEGYKLWLEWSATSDKHDASQMPMKWRSFKADASNAATLGGLRREQVAAPEQFEASTADPGKDTRPETLIKNLLEKRLVFVKRQALYYDLMDNSDTFLTDRAIQHLFCPHMPTIKIAGKNGKPDKVVQPDPVQHLRHSKTKLIADQVGIHPGAGRLYSEDRTDFVNRYTPEPIDAIRPEPFEVETLDFLWSRIADERMRVWLSKFYAYALQKPGVKIQTAPLLFSEETGTGKNTLAKMIPELLFGSRWVRGMSGDVLNSNFTDVLGETWWLYLEELKAGSNKVERIAIANKMKAWITDSRLTVHPKGLKPYDMRNRLQVIGTSNFGDALHLDDNDRRWAIMAMVPQQLTEREAYDLYHGFLLTPRAPGVLKYMFQRVDISDFNPAAKAPDSKAKKAMVVAGIGLWESKIVARMVAQEPPFDRDVFRLRDVTEQLVGLNHLTDQALSGLLKRAPFSCQMLHTAKGNFWCWRNFTPWKKVPVTAILKHMETGAYPSGGFSTAIPADILAMSPDGGVDSSIADLL